MRDFHLRFCLKEQGWYDGIIDLLGEAYDELPDTGGAYVLGTSNTMLVYPWGTSPIFYIGKAKSLRDRLVEHRKHIQGARDDDDEAYWWPRYQYGAAFGTDVAWYSRRGPQDPRNVEALLIERFYETFGAIPTANANWPSRIRPKGAQDTE